MKKINFGIALAILAAALYAVNAPFSKLLLSYMPSTLMAGFLYIGAGIGMCIVILIRKLLRLKNDNEKIEKNDLVYVVLMIALDIAAPIFLLIGLSETSAASASLLNNFEIAATALIAYIIFREKVSLRLGVGIAFVTLSCALLSFTDISSLDFSVGSLFVLLASFCWGLENNCTRKLSNKDPMQIVLLKGIFSGTGSLVIGFCIGERVGPAFSIFATLAVGFVAYGLSIFFYVYAQRRLGAARTSAYYAVAPFIGAFLSFIVFREAPGYVYITALVLMLIGAFLCAKDEPLFRRKNKR